MLRHVSAFVLAATCAVAASAQVGAPSEAVEKPAALVAEGIPPVPQALADRTRPFDVALPLTTLAVDEEHRPLDGDLGRAAVPAGTQATLDAVGHLAEVGITCTSVPTPRTRSLEEHLDHLRWVAAEIITAFPER